MAGIRLHEVADPVRIAWTSLRDEIRSILAGDLVAMWAHGGSTSVGDPAHMGDLDTHVIVAQRPDPLTAQKLDEAMDRVARAHAVETDTWYVHVDDARGTEPPRHAWRGGRRDTAWALHRAHWLAGRYVALHGPEPSTVVKPPAWDELENDLSRELEHIERHVFDGDTDPYEATYAILNCSRILHSVETHDVAISKREAGIWALEHLPPRWHDAVQAALHSYDRQATPGDLRLIAVDMARFVAFARERLPAADDRRAGEPPRWSGY